MTRAVCRDLTDEEEPEQHRLYMAAVPKPGDKPIDIGGLLYCRVHSRPLIECHDERGRR